MKHKETRTRQITESVTIKVTCDICGEDIGNTLDEVTVECREMYGGPDGGESETLSVDICVSCFKNKLVPWLAESGVTIQKATSEW